LRHGAGIAGRGAARRGSWSGRAAARGPGDRRPLWHRGHDDHLRACDAKEKCKALGKLGEVLGW